jgi:hypothetical protein
LILDRSHNLPAPLSDLQRTRFETTKATGLSRPTVHAGLNGAEG